MVLYYGILLCCNVHVLHCKEMTAAKHAIAMHVMAQHIGHNMVLHDDRTFFYFLLLEI